MMDFCEICTDNALCESEGKCIEFTPDEPAPAHNTFLSQSDIAAQIQPELDLIAGEVFGDLAIPTTPPPAPRSCGSCYTCCVWLGIEELKKHTGQSCRYLTGISGPTSRCGIYPTRPKACATYKCAWLEGLGPDSARPDRSGLLLTPYPTTNDTSPSAPFSVTIIITDPSLCGTLTSGYLGQFLDTLLRFGCNEIRVTNHHDKSVIYFKNGEVRRGKLLRGQTFEQFVCQLDEGPPLARYKVFQNPAEVQAWQEANSGSSTRIISP